jgi:chemotaxis protein histidine kinase CheA
MDDLLREFLTETSESLDTVDNQLVKFEQEPNNAKILDNIFRLVHTIKGTCGFLGLPRLEALAHAGETLMSKFRDGMPVTAGAVTLILASIDRIKEILSGLEATEAEPEGTDRDLIDKLEAMVEQGMAAMAAGSAAPVAAARAGSARRRCACACKGNDPGGADRPDPGASAASGRSLARRSRARLPRDRDRSAGPRCQGRSKARAGR